MTSIEKHYWYKEHEEEIEALFTKYFEEWVKEYISKLPNIKDVGKVDFSILNNNINMEKHSCINCGKEATQLHHVVPKELGGNNSINCVWLCDKCHGLIHNISYGNNQLSHSELTKLGLQKARERGVQLGGKKRSRTSFKKGRSRTRINAKIFKNIRWNYD